MGISESGKRKGGVRLVIMTIDHIKLLDSDTQDVGGSKIKQSRPAETLPPSYSLLTNSKDATTAITDNTVVVFSS
jgi:hypothetical protein